MTLPIEIPAEPMLAKAVSAIPAQGSIPGGYLYEPKWDGFRCLVVRDGDEVDLRSRGAKSLARYFPEVIETAAASLPERFVGDGELVVRVGEPGAQRLDWTALSQRIHPAASRVARLSAEFPAEMVFFDLLALGDDSLLDLPFGERRRRLEGVLRGIAAPAVHLTRVTDDAAVAQEWFDVFEGAGLDGVVAKPVGDPYSPGRRTMLKIKHSRTAECVVWGYRIHTSGQGVGSLLLAAHNADGVLQPVGGIGAFSNRTRLDLIDMLAPLVERDDAGEAVTGETERSRFASGKDRSFVTLRPELVVEVRFDQLEGERFRHAAQFVRWRPDRTPESCLLSDIDRAPAYDLSDVLADD
ncbi:ATP-dependent DNA ligase [Propionicicella superfundia]|uniref:ATP-dependent DNA ligase n=1 Tax=Propionicicella superfundia TaxID=348582 RepID=UPI00040E3CF9|nr:ATP-dependent DNA ligase [Propionicicella superfundia]